MSEIRVSVVLTNIVDQINALRGLSPSTQIIRTYTADAVVDADAISSVIPQHVVDALGVPVVDRRIARFAEGRSVSVNVVGPLQFDIDGRTTLDEAFVVGDRVVIGQTVLGKMDLIADYQNRKVIGNPVHPDQPVIKIR